MNVNKTMFLKMKVLSFFILPVLSSAQFDSRQDRVYLHVNRQVNLEQPRREFNIESDSLRSQRFVDEPGTQFGVYLNNNNHRNSFPNQKFTTTNDPSVTQTKTDENLRLRNEERRFKTNERPVDEDRTEEDRSEEENGDKIKDRRITNHGNGQAESNRGTSSRRTNQSNSDNQPSRRTIDDGTNQHNIVFKDPDQDSYTSKPYTHITENKPTLDNEIPKPVTDEDSTIATISVTPSVDDRAAFAGDKCPEGRVRFNGICIETDDDR